MIRIPLQHILTPFLIAFGMNGYAQQIFQHLYGGVNQEISLAAFQSPIGGIFYLGATTSTGSGSADPVIMKLDDMGNVIWARAIGGVNYDVAAAMTLAADSGLVYAGSTRSYNGNTADDLYFFKTDSLGGMQWAKTFSSTDLDIASAIIRTSDNGFAITGYTRGTGVKRVLLIRTDANGDTLFTNTYGGSGDDQGVELLQTADGGFVIIGKTFTQTLGESDILLLRTDASGNLLWAKSFGESFWDEGAGIIQLQDGNFLISGSTISFGQGNFDFLILKTDTSGNILWGKTYGGPNTDAIYTARENSDGTIVVSGYSNSLGYGHNLRMAMAENSTKVFHLAGGRMPSTGNQLFNDRGDDSTNVILMKVNAVGDTIWTRTFGDGAQDEAFHFSKMDDGGYLIAGFTTSYSSTVDSTQMLLIRTDSTGHSGCHEQDGHPIIDTTNFTTQSLPFTQARGINVNIVVSNSLAWNLNAVDACLLTEVPDHETDGIVIFPNPACNQVTVTNKQNKIDAIRICDLIGANVLSMVLPATCCQWPLTLDVSRLSSGIYFLQCSTPASEITKKIIIQKN